MIKIIQFPAARRHPSKEEAVLSAQLRRLADEVDQGFVRQLVITLIRPDGSVERVGSPLLKTPSF